MEEEVPWIIWQTQQYNSYMGKRFRGSFGTPSNITVTWRKRFRGSFGRLSNITVTWGKRFRGSFGRPSNITVTWGRGSVDHLTDPAIC
jgi:hypothetical protein